MVLVDDGWGGCMKLHGSFEGAMEAVWGQNVD